MDNKENKDIMAKCESMKDDPALMKECKDMLNTRSKNKIQMEDDPEQDYTNIYLVISVQLSMYEYFWLGYMLYIMFGDYVVHQFLLEQRI